MFKLQVSLISVALAVAALSSSVSAAPIPATHTPFFAKRADDTALHAREDGATFLAKHPTAAVLPFHNDDETPKLRVGVHASNKAPVQSLSSRQLLDGSPETDWRPLRLGHGPVVHPTEDPMDVAFAGSGKLDRRIVLTKDMQDELHRQGRTSLGPEHAPSGLLKNIRFRRELEERKMKPGSKPLTDKELLDRFGTTAVRVRDVNSQQDTPSHGAKGRLVLPKDPSIVGGLPSPPKGLLGSHGKDRRDETDGAEKQSLPAGGIHPLS